MDHRERFVTNENVARFMRLIEQEPSDTQRSLWKNLLVAEEDRYASEIEKLHLTERCRERCLQRIREQRSRVAAMNDGHPHVKEANLFLANLLDMLALIEFRIDRLKERLG